MKKLLTYAIIVLIFGAMVAMYAIFLCNRKDNCQYREIFDKKSPNGELVSIAYSKTCNLGLSSSYVNVAAVRKMSEWLTHKNSYPESNAFFGIDATTDAISPESNWGNNGVISIVITQRGEYSFIHSEVLGVHYKLVDEAKRN